MKKLLTGIVLISLNLISYGQFQNSSLPERLVPVISTPNHIRDMTCYSYGDLIVGGTSSDLYVSINSEGTPGVHYKRTVAGNSSAILDEGVFIIPGATLVKDAVILKNPDATSTNEYVVAALYTDNSGSNITFLEWATIGLVQTTNHLFSTSTAYYMKMDALALNYYAVVYELNGDMYSFCGATNGMYPIFGPSKLLLGNATSGPGGTRPDIAMTELPRPVLQPLGCNIKLYYTYIDLTNDECVVSYHPAFCTMFSSLPSVNLNFEHTIPPIIFGVPNCLAGNNVNPRYYDWALPRIDAPDKSEDSWSVIVEQQESYLECLNKDQVQVNAAYKINGGVIHDLILNNGSLTNTVPMDNFSNGVLTTSNVAVAFDQDNTFIHYGWGKTQEHPSLGDHDYIGLLYNTNIPDVELGSSGDAYRIIDFDAGYIPYIPTLAFSGQNIQIDNLYTVFVNSDNYTTALPEVVYDKHPLWGNIPGTGYRPGSTGISPSFKSSNQLQAKIYPNPFTDQLRISLPEKYQTEILSIRIADVTGRTLVSYEGTITAVNHYLIQKNTLSTLPSKQLYTLTLTLNSTQETVSYKIIKE